MRWTPQQAAAIQQARRWLANKRGPQVFRLFGFAGTGKTTLARELASGVKGDVLYAAYTGKAALVLRSKGCEGASTIHSLIYKAVEDEESGKVHFVRNRDSQVASAGLVVIDECSMVDEQLGADLLSYGVKVLVLGDPAQLPPVSGEGYFMRGKSDVVLTDIRRQAADNPIIYLASLVRQGERLKPGAYGTSRVVRRDAMSKDELREAVLGADQLLCGLNRTRHAFNARIRALKGLRGPEGADWAPAAGDRLICLRNNREKGFLNGGLWEVLSASPKDTRVETRIKSLDVDATAEADTLREYFIGTDKELDWKAKRNTDEFGFGWAMTVHKSQGSQWGDVLVYDESFAFREDREKHLYTGITRAAESVTIVQ